MHTALLAVGSTAPRCISSAWQVCSRVRICARLCVGYRQRWNCFTRTYAEYQIYTRSHTFTHTCTHICTCTPFMSEWVKVCTRVALVSVLLQSCVQIRHRNRHSHRYRLRTDTEKDTDADTTFTQTQVVCVVPPPPADSSRKVLRTWSTGRGRSACPTVLRLCTRMSGQRRGCSIVATRGTFSSYLAQGCPCKVMFTGLWPLICFSMMSPLVLCIQRLQWVLLKVISLLDVFVCVRVCMMYLCGCVCMYLRISLVGSCAPGPVRPCACLSDCMYVCVYVCIFVRVCVLRMASREDIGNTSVLTQIPRNHGTIT